MEPEPYYPKNQLIDSLIKEIDRLRLLYARAIYDTYADDACERIIAKDISPEFAKKYHAEYLERKDG